MGAFLFAATAVLWGSSAIVTGHQSISGAPEVSVGYRMVIVSLVMFCWSYARGQGLSLRATDGPWVALQGVLFFGLAFIAFYYSTTLLTSGISALVLSTASLFAALAGWIFLSTPVTLRMLAGIITGITGLVVIALPQIVVMSSGADTLAGVVLALVAAACTGCGTVVAMRNQKAGMPTTSLIAWAALFGTIFSFSLAAVRGSSFSVAVSLPYFAGLAYLAVVASCITFVMYFNLVQRSGPASASYTLAVVPVVALLLSVLFENLSIDIYLFSGAVAVLLGNILVLSDQGKAPKRPKIVPAEEGTS
ncbi:DMT family transporter [Roseibium sp. RKSG952]|uniref:DMT family transporter n=1 Tax=Roseibium sp. RKSG952 TaxID=2529384 RepID=UPI0012BCF8C0|nr:DMT family transporter [Roseibium sp. RKSG952]MTH95691.1 DMT family transporter [Roseibium sp. RKSG952]